MRFKNAYLFIWLCRVLAVACGAPFPDQGWNPDPRTGSTASQPLDHQGSPWVPALYHSFSVLTCVLTWEHKDEEEDESTLFVERHLELLQAVKL